MRGHAPVSEQGRASCPAAGTVALARMQVQSSCSHPPLGTLPASHSLLLPWPSQRLPALFWDGPDSAEEPKLAFLLTEPHTTISTKPAQGCGWDHNQVWHQQLWCSQRPHGPLTLVRKGSGTLVTLSHNEWLAAALRRTPSHRKTLCGLCHLRHDVVASTALQLQLETATHPSSPPVAEPGFMAAEAPDVPTPHQQHGQDLQHPCNRLVFSSGEGEEQQNQKIPRGNKDAVQPP